MKWISGGIGFRPELPPACKDDPAPFPVFDSGTTVELRGMPGLGVKCRPVLPFPAKRATLLSSIWIGVRFARI
jgi:hypothetical protein